MIADADLPVWSIKPNWSDGIIERLSWLTDVIAASKGTEQRRALRLSPRREFEMKFNPVDQTRSYFDLWLHRFGSGEFMVPLFHDVARLTAGIGAGAVTIPFDTTYREFVEGGLAILISDDPFTFDKVAITAIGADHLTVAAGDVTRAWAKGARIHPLRRSRISAESQLSGLTNRVSDATIQFQLNQANDISDEGEWATLYGDYPILTDPPNWRETLDLTFNRNSLVLDNGQGLTTLADDTFDVGTKARAFTIQLDHRMMVGRAQHWAFRQMLYRLRGQQGTVWLPTFNRDVELSQAALATDAALKIKKIGYAYTGGVIDGRQHVLFPGGSAHEISDVGVEPSIVEEQLLLAVMLGAPLPAGAFGSFIDTCRLSSDTIEIKHHTDTDGAAECDLAWRSFRDPRTIPEVISYPIPASAMGVDLCGSPAPEEASCVHIETGFYGAVRFEFDHGTYTPLEFPGINLYLTNGAGGFILTSDAPYWKYFGGPVLPYDGSTPRNPCIALEGHFLTHEAAAAFGYNQFESNPFSDPAPTFNALLQFSFYGFSDATHYGGSGLGRAFFKFPNGNWMPMICVQSGTQDFFIGELWPEYYDFVLE